MGEKWQSQPILCLPITMAVIVAKSLVTLFTEVVLPSLKTADQSAAPVVSVMLPKTTKCIPKTKKRRIVAGEAASSGIHLCDNPI